MSNANGTPINTEFAPGFAALGDHTRLSLLMKLSSRNALSITELSRGSKLTRQAITKHLRILEAERLICCEKVGREMHFELQPEEIEHLCAFLKGVSQQWENALSRLQQYVEA